ncbi:MAG: imidazole glycerol phosphate synthase subunit HisH [Chitinophagales bacterium]|nr:imidazole glycerol phosphate synthase subunit HisH [Chitinophagaceae bacterium]MCB9064642.1 imidazole glycerol phosphate synthase subunit HisH [Chitinophagales bacterium]
MIAIINYGLGNLTSIKNMCKRLSIDATITDDVDVIKNASHLLLPGVGHFKKGMANLHESGLRITITEEVIERGKPILGICLGAQLLTKHSEEGDVDGLGWVDANTVRFDAERLGKLPIPHMGWSDIKVREGCSLWEGLPEDPRFYFVHAYHFKFEKEEEIAATSLYGYEFACAFQKENIFGAQFHPEKSHKFGMKVLENFNKVGG